MLLRVRCRPACQEAGLHRAGVRQRLPAAALPGGRGSDAGTWLDDGQPCRSRINASHHGPSARAWCGRRRRRRPRPAISPRLLARPKGRARHVGPRRLAEPRAIGQSRVDPPRGGSALLFAPEPSTTAGGRDPLGGAGAGFSPSRSGRRDVAIQLGTSTAICSGFHPGTPWRRPTCSASGAWIRSLAERVFRGRTYRRHSLRSCRAYKGFTAVNSPFWVNHLVYRHVVRAIRSEPFPQQRRVT
jgi:hypothetical protein